MSNENLSDDMIEEIRDIIFTGKKLYEVEKLIQELVERRVSEQQAVIDETSKELGYLFLKIKKCQSILAEYVLPDSQTKTFDCVNNIIGELDDREFIVRLNEINNSLKLEPKKQIQ